MSPKLLNILLVLVPAMLYNFVYLPLTTGTPSVLLAPSASIRGLQTKNVQYANTLNLVTDIQTNIKKINDDYKAVSPATTTIVETMLPDTIDQLKLRKEVIAIADAAGVGLKEVKIREDRSSTAVGSYIIDFTFKARYKNAKLLLDEYEKNRRFYIINALNIKKIDPKGLSVEELQNIDKDALAITVSYRVNYLNK